jgi:putative flippase GtrA
MSSASVPFWKSFSRAQAASIAATVVDFGFLVLLVEKGGVWYVAATAAGAFLGAITNFTLNRHWSFKATSERVHGQVLKYGVVSGGSLLLNSGGVWAFTESTGISYLSSKIVTALLVGLFFNFPLHRYFVFKSSQAGLSVQQ